MSDSSAGGEYLKSKSDIEHDSYVLFYEFQYKTIMEASSKLMQFSLAFFSISSLLTAFGIFSNLDVRSRNAIILCIFIMIFVFAVIGFSIIYGVVVGLLQIRENFKSISKTAYDIMNMESYFRRGLRVIYVVAISSVLGLFAIVYVIFSY